MKSRALLVVMGLILPLLVNGQDNSVILEEFIYDEAPFKSCHASTIAETKSGIFAAWFGGTHEKHVDVEIWASRKYGKDWTDPISIAKGIYDGNRYPCWNPVLYYSEANRLYLFYKVGPSPTEWWGMLKYSDDDGHTWSQESRLPDGIIGPVKNKPVPLGNNTLLCPSSTEHDGWKVQMEVYDLKEDSWAMPMFVHHNSSYNVIQPTIFITDNGFKILCRSKEGYIISSESNDRGNSWGNFKSTALPNPNSGLDGVTMNNGKHIIVYNHSGTPEGEWGGKRYPLNIAVSANAEIWKAGIVLERNEGEYSYPAVIQSADGLLHILYTWNRLKIKHVVVNPALLPEMNIEVWEQ